MSYEGIITIEPGKRGGQPCIRGLRITVYDVLSYLASGMTEEEIISDYPDLTHDDIVASLCYTADRSARQRSPTRETTSRSQHLPQISGSFGGFVSG